MRVDAILAVFRFQLFRGRIDEIAVEDRADLIQQLDGIGFRRGQGDAVALDKTVQQGLRFAQRGKQIGDARARFRTEKTVQLGTQFIQTIRVQLLHDVVISVHSRFSNAGMFLSKAVASRFGFYQVLN